MAKSVDNALNVIPTAASKRGCLMTVQVAVADGDINAKLDSKFGDLKRRIREGTLPLDPIARVVQEMIEGDFILGGLLKFVGAVELKPNKRFVVADNFKVGNVVGGRTIAWIGNNFHHHFDDVVEEDVPARTINIWELVKGSRDPVIIIALGGEDKPNTQTHLAHTFQMMKLGEKGKSRLDGYANLGYKLSPKDGKLWVPRWNVNGGKLSVEANSSSRPDEWYDGGRVSGG